MDLIPIYKQILIREVFYGTFLLGIRKEITTKCATASIAVEGVNTKLLINASFFEGLTNVERYAVIKHELLHMCFQHLVHMSKYSDRQVFNLAADCEINQYITGLPEGHVNLHKLNKICKLTMMPKGGTKYYYDQLIQCKRNNPKLFSEESMQMDSHDSWEDFEKLPEATKQLAQQQTQHQLQEAAKQISATAGKLPGEMQDIIDDLFKPKIPQFDWKKYLRRFLSSTGLIYTKKTLRKNSNRFPDSAGLKIKNKAHVLVAVDTSMSINSTDLQAFFSEINAIYRVGTKVTIIECDTIIQRIYPYTGHWDGTAHGRGGTEFTPVFEYLNQNLSTYASLVFFTDGYGDYASCKTIKPTMWVISSNGHRADYPGHKIYLDDAKNN